MTDLPKFSLIPQPGDYAISKLPAGSALPEWVGGDGLVSVTIAEDELSIVCLSDRVPETTEAERGWRALKVETTADLDEPGVILSAVQPVAEAELGVFVISTYLRDYLLVRADEQDVAFRALIEAGHRIDAANG
ncbi:ACT domain-containing protein [Pelagovum pacificum]|uniref:ACT domain-containing protein n=1 Tax=Pelagovum pacificum TaxID=2588711 RepID=A0A5C5GFP5_9RHOB|nr:ACT domain-containing protein [Pelagovum pacificum]QQA44100.1 ACT domain-containing protein [Pelagovum pacificum]TNY32771.1 ACT domain-containing protein [Pelagovum pacificum]